MSSNGVGSAAPAVSVLAGAVGRQAVDSVAYTGASSFTLSLWALGLIVAGFTALLVSRPTVALPTRDHGPALLGLHPPPENRPS